MENFMIENSILSETMEISVLVLMVGKHSMRIEKGDSNDKENVIPVAIPATLNYETYF